MSAPRAVKAMPVLAACSPRRLPASSYVSPAIPGIHPSAPRPRWTHRCMAAAFLPHRSYGAGAGASFSHTWDSRWPQRKAVKFKWYQSDAHLAPMAAMIQGTGAGGQGAEGRRPVTCQTAVQSRQLTHSACCLSARLCASAQPRNTSSVFLSIGLFVYLGYLLVCPCTCSYLSVSPSPYKVYLSL